MHMCACARVCVLVCIKRRWNKKRTLPCIDCRLRRGEPFRHRSTSACASTNRTNPRREKKREERRALPVALVPEPPRLPGCSCPEKTLLTHLSDIVQEITRSLAKSGRCRTETRNFHYSNCRCKAVRKARDRDERVARKLLHGSRSSSLTRHVDRAHANNRYVYIVICQTEMRMQLVNDRTEEI